MSGHRLHRTGLDGPRSRSAKSTLGVDVDDDFAPTYLVPRDKTKLVKELEGVRPWRSPGDWTPISEG